MHLRVECCSNEGLRMMWMAWDVRKICILDSKKSRKMFKKLENLILRTFGVFLAQKIRFSLSLIPVKCWLILIRLKPFIIDHLTPIWLLHIIIVIGINVIRTNLATVQRRIIFRRTQIDTVTVSNRVNIDLLHKKVIIKIFRLVFHVQVSLFH
jgi:hypothetical protein